MHNREGDKMEMPNEPLEMNQNNFDEILEQYPVVLVDGWAGWCMPCRMIAPAIKELAKEMEGEVVFGKLNVDDNGMLAQQLGMFSIPSLLLFKEGKLVGKTAGAMPKDMLKDWISQVLAAA